MSDSQAASLFSLCFRSMKGRRSLSITPIPMATMSSSTSATMPTTWAATISKIHRTLPVDLLGVDVDPDKMVAASEAGRDTLGACTNAMARRVRSGEASHDPRRPSQTVAA